MAQDFGRQGQDRKAFSSPSVTGPIPSGLFQAPIRFSSACIRTLVGAFHLPNVTIMG